MKQSVLIASVLGGGVALGAAGLAGYQALKQPSAVTASQPVAVAKAAPAQAVPTSAPVAVAAAAAPQPASTPAAAPTTPTPVAAAKPAPQHDAYARVLSVKPITEASTGSKQQCQDVQVQRQRPVQDQNRVAGTVIGGVLGGVLGHQVGSGHGNDVATVVGALAGGYAGNKAQERIQQNDTYTDTETRCQDVATTHRKIVGYRVRYTLDGKTGTVRMDHKPGKRIPAQNGKLLLD